LKYNGLNKEYLVTAINETEENHVNGSRGFWLLSNTRKDCTL